MLVVAVFAWWWGVFSQSWSDGMCYTRVIDSVARLSTDMTSQTAAHARERMDKALAEMPMRGYETDCDEVERYWAKAEKSLRTQLAGRINKKEINE